MQSSQRACRAKIKAEAWSIYSCMNVIMAVIVLLIAPPLIASVTEYKPDDPEHSLVKVVTMKKPLFKEPQTTAELSGYIVNKTSESMPGINWILNGAGSLEPLDVRNDGRFAFSMPITEDWGDVLVICIGNPPLNGFDVGACINTASLDSSEANDFFRGDSPTLLVPMIIKVTLEKRGQKVIVHRHDYVPMVIHSEDITEHDVLQGKWVEVPPSEKIEIAREKFESPRNKNLVDAKIRQARTQTKEKERLSKRTPEQIELGCAIIQCYETAMTAANGAEGVTTTGLVNLANEYFTEHCQPMIQQYQSDYGSAAFRGLRDRYKAIRDGDAITATITKRECGGP